MARAGSTGKISLAARSVSAATHPVQSRTRISQASDGCRSEFSASTLSRAIAFAGSLVSSQARALEFRAAVEMSVILCTGKARRSLPEISQLTNFAQLGTTTR